MKAEELRREQRDNPKLASLKREVMELLTEKFREGWHGVVFSFELYQQEGTIELHKCGRWWWSVSEKHRIPLVEYLEYEGFVVRRGPLYGENIEVTL